MTYTIYALRELGETQIRYVGATRQLVSERFAQHVMDARRSLAGPTKQSKRALVQWTSSVLAGGRTLEGVLLIRCEDEEWKYYERAVIAAARDAGLPLLNQDDGGASGSYASANLRRLRESGEIDAAELMRQNSRAATERGYWQTPEGIAAKQRGAEASIRSRRQNQEGLRYSVCECGKDSPFTYIRRIHVERLGHAVDYHYRLCHLSSRPT